MVHLVVEIVVVAPVGVELAFGMAVAHVVVELVAKEPDVAIAALVALA